MPRAPGRLGTPRPAGPVRWRIPCALGLALALAAVVLAAQDATPAPNESDPAPSPQIKIAHLIDQYGKDRPFRDPMSIDVDPFGASGEVLIADTGNNTVAVFSPSGTLKMAIGKVAALSAPIGAVFDPNGELIISEMDSPILKVMSVRGALADKIDLSSYAPEGGDPVNPGRMCMDARGNLYVVDRANQQVLVLDPQHRLKRRVGGRGHEEGQLRMLQDVAVDPDGTLFLVSGREAAVHVFGDRGDFRFRFGDHGFGKASFSFPSGIAVDHKGRIWVADSVQHAVKVFDRGGGFLFEWFGVDEKHALDFPADLAFDGGGRLYVLEKGACRVQVLEIQEGGGK